MRKPSKLTTKQIAALRRIDSATIAAVSGSIGFQR